MAAPVELTGDQLQQALARPWHPTTDAALLRDPFMTPVDMNRFLAYCRGQSEQNQGPYIHRGVVSFKDGPDKANYRDLVTYHKLREHFNDFMRTRKAGKQAWIAWFNTPTRSYVGVTRWSDIPWHSWAAAVVQSPAGKHILIMDCDANQHQGDWAEQRRRGILPAGQQAFVACLRAQNYRVAGVWLRGLDDNQLGQDRCIEHTAHWIARQVTYPDSRFNPTAGTDPRFPGFVRLSDNP